MLLTSMPNAMDYFFLGSIFFLALSIVVSIVIIGIIGIIGIIALIKKDKKTSKEYLFWWLKIFGIMFVSIELLSFIVLVSI